MVTPFKIKHSLDFLKFRCFYIFDMVGEYRNNKENCENWGGHPEPIENMEDIELFQTFAKLGGYCLG